MGSSAWRQCSKQSGDTGGGSMGCDKKSYGRAGTGKLDHTVSHCTASTDTPCPGLICSGARGTMHVCPEETTYCTSVLFTPGPVEHLPCSHHGLSHSCPVERTWPCAHLCRNKPRPPVLRHIIARARLSWVLRISMHACAGRSGAPATPASRNNPVGARASLRTPCPRAHLSRGTPMAHRTSACVTPRSSAHPRHSPARPTSPLPPFPAPLHPLPFPLATPSAPKAPPPK